MTTLSSIASVSLQSTDQFHKSFGSITYNQVTFEKAGTLVVGYGGTQLSFTTVTDYLIFVNQIIIPLTNTVLSSTGNFSTPPATAMVPGVIGVSPIVD